MFRTPAAKALAFFKESPEYSDKMSITEKYNTHFASQYREKVGSRLI
jgi:ADP-ribosylation factor GTPase-activating protein 1